MGVVINGKTAEDIKARQEACVTHASCKVCPYEPDETCDVFEVLENARALIEHLESERDAALAKVPKWISVEERLPLPETERYLVACIWPDGNRTVHTTVWAWDENGEKGDWINWNVVTHWMPLPEAPKEGE